MSTFMPVFFNLFFLVANPSPPEWEIVSHPAKAEAMAVHLSRAGSSLIMSWLTPESKHSGTFHVARHQDNQWQKTVDIHTSDQLFINWADIPKTLIGPELSIAVWPEMIGEGTYAYGLRYRTSSDGGQTWHKPQWLHEDLQPKEHGFVSLARLDDSRISAVWLDGRAMGGDHGAPGNMQLRYREITPKGLSPEIMLDDMTCECCGTDMVIFKDQPMVIYRNRNPEHIRDIQWAARQKNGQWLKSQALPSDQWQIHGCPVNGPSLIQNGHAKIATWFTMAAGKPQIRLARQSGQDPKWTDFGKIGKLPLGRVHSAFLDKNHYLLVWLESGEDHDAIYYAIFNEASKKPLVPPTRLDATGKGRASGFPKLTTIDGTGYIAYQDPQKPGIKLQRLAWLSRKSLP